MQLHRDRYKIDSVKTCDRCGRTLHEAYPYDRCPDCMEYDLFSEVKEYIRNNDVREQDVAEKFNIPVTKVRSWIREGRIQYKGDNTEKIGGIYCRMCGKAIAFGNLCPQCHALQQLQVVSSYKKMNETAGEMHFLGKNEKK